MGGLLPAQLVTFLGESCIVRPLRTHRAVSCWKRRHNVGALRQRFIPEVVVQQGFPARNENARSKHRRSATVQYTMKLPQPLLDTFHTGSRLREFAVEKHPTLVITGFSMEHACCFESLGG